MDRHTSSCRCNGCQHAKVHRYAALLANTKLRSSDTRLLIATLAVQHEVSRDYLKIVADNPDTLISVFVTAANSWIEVGQMMNSTSRNFTTTPAMVENRVFAEWLKRSYH